MSVAMSEQPLRVYYLDGVRAAASVRYRVFNALEQLRTAGAHAMLLPRDYDPEKALSNQREGPGVLVVHRAPWDERLACLLEAARSHGIRTLYDIDDLVFEPIALPWVRALSRLSGGELDVYEDEVRRYFRALKSCDGVLTTTRALASYAAAEGLPVFVHRNGFDQRSLDTARAAREARKPRGEVVLYYGAGSGTHDVDFQACAPALERLLRKHSSLQLMAQGEVRLGQRLDGFAGRVRRWPWMPWPDYLQGVAEGDINIAPLELGNPFCEVKSELKWFEAALTGTPTVASATDAFREVIRSGENGFLAESYEQWFEILDELVREPQQRESVGGAAASEALSRYEPAAMGRQLLDLLSRVASADNLTELARAMGDRAAVPTRLPAQARAKEAPEEAAPVVAVSNGRRRPLDGLALDITCRREDGILGALRPEAEVAQTFQCTGANLAAIAVKAARYERANPCSLEMSLYAEGSAPPLQRMQESVLEATDDGWVIFRFPPIEDSAGKAYRFVVSSPDAGPGNACGLYHAQESLYGEGKLEANGRAGNGALVFQTFLERRDTEEIRDLIRPERANMVADLLTVLTQRDAELAEKETVIGQKDDQLALKDTLLAEQDALLAEKDAMIVQKDSALAAGEAALAERDQMLSALSAELEAIRQSKGYRLLKGYRAITRRLFPASSWRGALYRSLVRPVSYVLDLVNRRRK